MTLSLGALSFITSWCILLFVVLPFYIRPERQKSEMDYAAAPAPVPWRRVFLVNTILSLLFTLALALVVNSGWFPMDTL